MKKNNIVRAIFSVTGIVFLAKLIGFVKQMVVSSAFGATLETDLINLSQEFIGNIQYILMQVLLTSVIPLYIYLSQEGDDKVKPFVADTIKVFTLIAGGLAAILMLTAPWIAKIIAPTYSSEVSAALSGYLRFFSPGLLLFAWIAIFQSLMNANKRFIPGEMIGLNQSIIIIALVFLFKDILGVKILCVAFFAYSIFNALYLGLLSRRYWRLSVGNPFANDNIKKLLRVIAPLLLGHSAVYINQQVNKILVSGMAAGTVTSLGYAAVLSNLIVTFIVSFSSILFSYITSLLSAGKEKQAADLTKTTVTLMVAVLLPISILVIVCAENIVSIAFGRGAFGAESVHVAGLALAGYGFIFIPSVLREVFSRFLYSYQNTRTPSINSAIGIGVNIGLSVLLYRPLGVFGVTLAASAAELVCGILNLIYARKHNTHLQIRAMLKNVPLLLVGGAVCLFIGKWAVGHWGDSSSFVRFAMATLLAFIGYFAVISPLLYRLLKERKQLNEA